jgi:hypothetical protein
MDAGLGRHDGSPALGCAEILAWEHEGDSAGRVESQDALSWDAAVKSGTKQQHLILESRC